MRLASHRPLDVLIATSEAAPIVSEITTRFDRLTSGLTGLGHHATVLSMAQIPSYGSASGDYPPSSPTGRG